LDLELPGSPEGPRHRYLLCSRVMHGFILKSRTWGKMLKNVDFSLPASTDASSEIEQCILL
jgi:hypothetical protein